MSVCEVSLSSGGITLVDEADLDREIEYTLSSGEPYSVVVSQRTWRAYQSSRSPMFYVRTNTRRRGIRKQWHVVLHRLVAGARPGQIVDHINGDTLDNRRCNLRICTAIENSRNATKRGGSSRFKGVSRRSDGRFRAQIGFNRKKIRIGDFIDEAEAARAYDEAALKYFGEFARLNFPLVAT